MDDSKSIARICLVMTATNEEHKILKALESIAPYICAAVIVDSGNKDRTEEVSRQFLEGHGIDCWFDMHEFTGGGAQRSYALKLAHDLNITEARQWDYYLNIDADNVFHLEDGAGNPFVDLTGDCYDIRKRMFPNTSYSYICLFTTRYLWAFEGILHEFPVRADKQIYLWSELSGCWIDEEYKTEEVRDLKTHYYDHALRIEHELFYNKDLDKQMRIRYTYYLAQSWRDCSQPDRAIEWYQKRAEIGRNSDAWGLYDEELYETYIALGQLTKNIEYFMQAWQEVPDRLEAAYYLMQHWQMYKLPSMALMIGTATLQCWKANPVPRKMMLLKELYDGEFERLYKELMETKR